MTGDVAGPSEIALEFEDASLGDRRLDRRLLMIAERFSRDPEASFPKMLTSAAELEGAYRFLENESVDYSEIIAPHARATSARCREHNLIRIAHDSSDFAYEGHREGLGPIGGKVGFVAHMALALSSGEERAPLGILGMKTHMHKRNEQKLTLKERKLESRRKSREETLSSRWFDLAVESETFLENRSSCIHIMDREADDFALFFALLENGSRFVIRGESSRRTAPRNSGNIADKLEVADAFVLRIVSLSGRSKSRGSHKARHERLASLAVRGTRVKLGRPAHSRTRPWSSIEINVVQVFEPEPPKGEQPIAWTLYTSEDISTHEAMIAVVDHYRARWRIEEFFKCLKSGCSMEKRQLMTYEALVRALAISLPIAWRLLALRTLAQTPEPLPADILFDDVQIHVIRTLASDIKLSDSPSIRDTMLAIADIGGHIKSNGDPGWLVLARGYSDFMKAERTWRAALAFAAMKK
jgi:hypothetical protein